VSSLYCPVCKSQDLSSELLPKIVPDDLVQSIEQKYARSVPGSFIVKPII
jgi:hypothetical protein